MRLHKPVHHRQSGTSVSRGSTLIAASGSLACTLAFNGERRLEAPLQRQLVPSRDTRAARHCAPDSIVRGFFYLVDRYIDLNYGGLDMLATAKLYLLVFFRTR
jgi:hypothetical protein